MKAIVYHGPRDFRVESIDDPKLVDENDALIRIGRTAICGSDLHLYHGEPLPVNGFAMGHEFLGVVEDVGSGVRRFKRGDRVLASCTLGCGDCSLCRRGVYSGCQTLTSFGPLTNVFGNPLQPGGQAEAARVPFADTNLFRIPDGVEDEQALFLTDILPTGYMGADLGEVEPGDVVVVFGCGPVGTFAQRAAQLRGAAVVIAVDLDAGRRQKAETRGCLALDPEREDLVERVRELTGGRGADCAIEAVGLPELVLRAIDVTRPGGRVSVIGVITANEVPVPFLQGMMAKNLTLRSGLVNPQVYVPRLLPLIEQGRLDPTEIITHRLPLEQGIRGYEIFDAHEEDVLKVVLEP
jgi:threonine dehydrogenase-like Zn-dependent dehydrogenase